jgi:single-strand DNA-binding protein
VLWQSENVATYLTKGKQIYLEGRLHTRNYEDKDGKKVWVTEVVADDVILLGGRGEGGGGGAGQESYSQPVSMPRTAPRPQPAAAPAEQPEPPMDQGITDEDVPF